MHSISTYLQTNYMWLVPVILYVMTNVANALMNHPQAQSVLMKLVDLISFFTHTNSPGTLKFPMSSSQKPKE